MNEVIGLIGGASGKELTEQIHKRGFRVALVSGKKDEPGDDIADYVLTSDLRNIEKVRYFFAEHEVKYLIIGTGHRFAFKLAEELEKSGIVLNVNISASEIAKEKRVFKDFLVEKGFVTPTYYSIKNRKEMPAVNEIVAVTGLPCVVKATVDTILPQKASTEAELAEAVNTALDSGSPVIVEQFIKGIDITVFVSASKGKAKALPICYYSKAEDNDMKGFTNQEYIKEHLSSTREIEIMHYCEKLVQTCEFEGLPRIDLMVVPDDKAFVLEANSVGVTGINPRHEAYCKGTVLYLKQLGIDVAEVLVDTALVKFGLLQGDVD